MSNAAHKRGDYVIYTAASSGARFNARVTSVHRDDSYTISVVNRIEPNGAESGYLGFVWRVPADMLTQRTNRQPVKV